MDQDALLGLAAVAALLVGGLFSYGLLQRWAFPYRIKLFERGAELLDLPNLTTSERDFINFMLDGYDSFYEAWIVPHAMWRSLTKKIRGETGAAASNHRAARMLPPFLISVLAANPIALFLTLLMTPALLIAAAIREHERPKQAFRDAAREVKPWPLRPITH